MQSQKSKKGPERRCVGCGAIKPKSELIRITKQSDGTISLDRTGKNPGRGAYLCANADCIATAKKAHRFERSFRCRVPVEIYEEIANECK